MITIRHPRPELGRQSFAGVDFVDGVATVEDLHPERKLALLQHGFTLGYVGELTDDSDSAVFEPLPVAVEGDTTPKTSRRRKA